MSKRIISSVVGFPILVFVITIGGWYLQLSLMVLALMAVSELYHAISKKRLPVHYAGYLFVFIYYFLLHQLNSTILLVLPSLFIMVILTLLVMHHEKINILDCAVTWIGFYYGAFLLSFIFLVRNNSYGSFFVWLIFISAWGSDTFAYFVGTAMGKHNITPRLSPTKTWEGAIGGVLGATSIAVVYGVVYARFLTVGEDINVIVFCAISGAVGAIFSQFGDLAASAIKRYTGVKDFGKVIPGHGGIMDRFDSIMYTAPSVYFVMLILLENMPL